jgi:hypothetical protein
VKREELEIAIVAATEVIRQREVIVIGSQSVLGSFSEAELPERATMSNEADIASLHDDAAETLATLIDTGLGEWSDFDRDHGFYVQGVSVRTAYLEFVDALIDSGLVTPSVVRERIALITDKRFEPERKAVATRWMRAREHH